MTLKHIEMQTPNGAQLNLDALYHIFPQCFIESKDPKLSDAGRSLKGRPLFNVLHYT